MYLMEKTPLPYMADWRAAECVGRNAATRRRKILNPEAAVCIGHRRLQTMDRKMEFPTEWAIPSPDEDQGEQDSSAAGKALPSDPAAESTQEALLSGYYA